MRVPTAQSEARVLIVDPERRVGVDLTTLLAARKYDDVRAVRSAVRAIAIAEQFRPTIVFLDLDLPDGGCMIVARQLLRARETRPRMIALTSEAKHPLREEARLAGFDRFMLKPVSNEELDEILGIAKTAA
jgi:CheY-like chemotaxis protein